jgi:hypothetical protein
MNGRRCRVFWYTHGCDRDRGHRDLHACMAGHEPYTPFYRGWFWYSVFGEDTTWTERQITRFLDPLQKVRVYVHTLKIRHRYRKQELVK